MFLVSVILLSVEGEPDNLQIKSAVTSSVIEGGKFDLTADHISDQVNTIIAKARIELKQRDGLSYFPISLSIVKL